MQKSIVSIFVLLFDKSRNVVDFFFVFSENKTSA